MIEIYPSNLPGEPFERHDVCDGTLHDWLSANCPSYKPGHSQPVCATVSGRVVPPSEWHTLRLSDRVELRPQPLDGGLSLWVIGALVLGSVAVAMLLRPSVPSSQAGRRGSELQAADIQANTPRLNQIIPEIAGRYRVFPDYLCQPRRYFLNETTQAIEVMLCVGMGDYQVNSLMIGETDAASLGSSVSYAAFGPGDAVTGNTAHENWYPAPEVGATTGSAGLRLTAGTSRTESASLSNYLITGSSIVAPPGAGILPQDWETGMTVEITIQNRTVTIVDGGGSIWSPVRDYVRGDFADLDLSTGDFIRLTGCGPNDGRYRVSSISSTTTPGTASRVTGVKVAPLDYELSPVMFSVAGQSVTLDEDYADADDLVDAIAAQVGGATVSHVDGSIRIVDDSPFDGQQIALAGYSDPVFGASPLHVVGAASVSYDELRLDSWQTWDTWTSDSGSAVGAGWAAAASMTPGVYSAASVAKVRVESVWENQWASDGYQSALVEVDYPTAYRITAVIAGTLPDSTEGTVGYTLQRLLPSGVDDPTWGGFHPEGQTPNVTLTLQASNVIGGWVGPFLLTPGDELSDAIEFDVFAPQGVIRYNKEGKVRAHSVGYEAQYRVNGGAWQSIVQARTYSTQDQLGWTHRVNLPAPGRAIEMRMRRTSGESGSAQVSDRLEWYGARARLAAASSYPGVTSIALKIVGSDKISARTDNQVSVDVTRKFNGALSRSIADWVRYVCSSVGYSSNDLDEDVLSELAATWSLRGDTYDNATVDQTTVKNALAAALRAGFAELTIDNGKIRPVRDEPRSVFEHMYSPQNMLKPLRRKFVCPDLDDYDGVDVEYTSSTTWKQEVVECRLPGDMGRRISKIKLAGVTDRTRAWRIGMRERRAQRYRKKEYSFETELDALNSRYLSYCALSDDVPGYSRSAVLSGLEQIGDSLLLVLSEPLTWEPSASHVVAMRRPDGSLFGPVPALPGPDEFSALISDDLDFEPVLIAENEEPTHVVFGTVATWSYPVLITNIVPSGETVDVTAVNYDGRVYLDDDNTPP